MERVSLHVQVFVIIYFNLNWCACHFVIYLKEIIHCTLSFVLVGEASIFPYFVHRYQRGRPIIVDPGLYNIKKSDVFWAKEKRSMPHSFKLFIGIA